MSTSKSLRQQAAALAIEWPTTANLMRAAADELEEAHKRVADLQLEPAAMAATMIKDGERIAELETLVADGRAAIAGLEAVLKRRAEEAAIARKPRERAPGDAIHNEYSAFWADGAMAVIGDVRAALASPTPAAPAEPPNPMPRVAEAIASRFVAGDSVAELVDDYGHTALQVEAAIRTHACRPVEAPEALAGQDSGFRQRIAGLIHKWLGEQMKYPDTEAGNHAAAAVRLCAKELGDVLNPPQPAPFGHISKANPDEDPERP